MAPVRRNRHLHPSRQKLQDWLGGERPELDEHIHNCFRCAERLEESNQVANPIAAALTTLLAPPANLQPRLSGGSVLSSRVAATGCWWGIC